MLADPEEPSAALTRDDLKVEGLPIDDRVWRVVWYCGINRNFTAPSEPRVTILLVSSGAVDFDHRICFVGLTHLGIVEVGSRWRNARYVDSAKTIIIEIVLDPATQHLGPPKFIRKLARVEDLSCLPFLEYRTAITIDSYDDDSVVLMPSLELFSRCFGASQYVKRILATSTFGDALANLVARDRMRAADIPKDHQLITLTKRCHDADGPFISSMTHDTYAQASIREFCGSLQAFNDRRQYATVAPTVKTWWASPLKMQLRGIWRYVSGRSFFVVFRIMGMELVPGQDLIVDRENTNRTQPIDEESGVSRIRERGERRSESAPTIDRIVNSIEPSPILDTVRVEEEPFIILGGTRKIMLANTAKPRNETAVEEANNSIAEAISGGGYGDTGANVAAASIYYRSLIEPIDQKSSDVLSALEKIVAGAPSASHAIVEVWSGRLFQRFHKTLPLLIVDRAKSDVVPWVIIRHGGPERSRCFYLTRLTIAGKHVFFLDIERRQKGSVDTEHLSGLGFVVDGTKDVASVVDLLLLDIIGQRGTMSNVVAVTGSRVLPYRHMLDPNAMVRLLKKLILNLSSIDVDAVSI